MGIEVPGKRTGRGQRARQPQVPELVVTPLVDMFVIIVLFLISNFSATGELLCMCKGVALPVSRNAQEIEAAPVVTITPTEVLLSGALIAAVEDFSGALLEEKLRDERKKFEDLHAPAFAGAFTDVNIQADRSLSFGVVRRVMVSCAASGFDRVNFVALTAGGLR
jgi:biopolymer transport protein ExbD